MIKHTEKNFFEKISVKNKKAIQAYSYKIKIWKAFVKEKFDDPDFIPQDNLQVMLQIR